MYKLCNWNFIPDENFCVSSENSSWPEAKCNWFLDDSRPSPSIQGIHVTNMASVFFFFPLCRNSIWRLQQFLNFYFKSVCFDFISLYFRVYAWHVGRSQSRWPVCAGSSQSPAGPRLPSSPEPWGPQFWVRVSAHPPPVLLLIDY